MKKVLALVLAVCLSLISVVAFANTDKAFYATDIPDEVYRYYNSGTDSRTKYFYHPASGSFLGSSKVTVNFRYDGSSSYIVSATYSNVLNNQEYRISTNITNVSSNKIKVVATCVPLGSGNSQSITYYLTATPTGNLNESTS